MSGLEVWTFRLLVIVALALFGVQMATRIRLIAAGGRNLRLDRLPQRTGRFLVDVVLQARVLRAKPWVGAAHLGVFWGFVAFGGFTLVESLHGLGIVDLTGTGWFDAYRLLLVPFALAVLAGITLLLVRRGLLRPPELGAAVSRESLLIGGFIAALMVTFLLDFGLEGTAARVNWWAHMAVILAFLVLIPDSKHLHLVLSPATVFLKSPVLGDVPNLDFEREEVGFETVGDLPAKQRLDAFTCVECGRCQESCPAYATGKALNPKKLVLDAERALLGGRLEAPLAAEFDEGVLWQCTTCGACENECPVGIEHLPLILGARRGLVSNGEAPAYLGPVFNHLERRGNIWGLGYEAREKFLATAGVETFDRARHTHLVWIGCAGAFDAEAQRSLRALFDILRARDVRFGVLARERCNGDPAKRTGNEYLFQELASANVEEIRRAGAARIVTSCPHCLKTIGQDYRAFGLEVEVVHAAVLVSELTRDVRLPASEDVAFHDPCYLGRYAGITAEPRALLDRVGARVREPERHGDNPFCCGAGGGLLFEEHEPGKRISQERFEQLEATGARTVVTACPFCSIMLKGAQASAQASTELVDLVRYVRRRLEAGAPGTGEARDTRG